MDSRGRLWYHILDPRFDPALVVLGGGIMGEPYILSQLERMAASMVKPSFRGCRVVARALGNNAGRRWGAGHLAANIGSGWHPPRLQAARFDIPGKRQLPE